MSETQRPDVAALLAELARLESEATPGPWKALHEADADVRVCRTEEGVGCVCCLALMGEADTDGWSAETLRRWKADAAFIAALRNAAPVLLQVLQAEREARERAEFEAAELRVQWTENALCGHPLRWESENEEGGVSCIGCSVNRNAETIQQLAVQIRGLHTRTEAAEAEAQRLRTALRDLRNLLVEHHEVTAMRGLELGHECPVCVKPKAWETWNRIDAVLAGTGAGEEGKT